MDGNAAFIVRACNSHAALLADNERLRAALEAVEWSAYDVFCGERRPVCPSCSNQQWEGHKPLCDLRAALALTLPS